MYNKYKRIKQTYERSLPTKTLTKKEQFVISLKLIEKEYADSHHRVTQTLSSIDRDKKCRDKVEHTCQVDPNCIWCLGPDKGCYGGSSAGITHAVEGEKCNHFMFNGQERKHISDGLGITHKVN